MDLVELYRRTVAEFGHRLPDAQSPAWLQPTPCPGWTARALVNHVVGEERWVVPLFSGATIGEVGGALDGDLLGTDPVGQARAAASASTAAIAAPDALGRIVHLSFGDTPAQEYVRQLCADHLIHAWDLAAGIGADRSLDPELVEDVATWFTRWEDGYRQAGAIGPRVEVPPEASAQDRLLGAFGRSPDWTATQ
jgi:uncharacterized protein (TIGR03086 family)